MASWPATLPPPTVQGHSEAEPDNVVSSQMDSGPPKIRRRSSNPRVTVQAHYVLTAAQRDTLRTFYRTTTAYGSLSFTMDGATHWFKPGSPPVFTPLSGGRWAADCSFLRIA